MTFGDVPTLLSVLCYRLVLFFLCVFFLPFFFKPTAPLMNELNGEMSSQHCWIKQFKKCRACLDPIWAFSPGAIMIFNSFLLFLNCTNRGERRSCNVQQWQTSFKRVDSATLPTLIPTCQTFASQSSSGSAPSEQWSAGGRSSSSASLSASSGSEKHMGEIWPTHSINGSVD